MPTSSTAAKTVPNMRHLLSDTATHDDLLPFNQNLFSFAPPLPHPRHSSTPSTSPSAPNSTSTPTPTQPSPASPLLQHHHHHHFHTHRSPKPAPSPPLNVVVTGGSSGIGAAIVHTFATAGHRVLFTYYSGRQRAEALHAQHRPNTTFARLDQADVTSVAALSRVVSQWAAGRGIDVLVNNAALGSATVDKYVEDNACTTKSTSISNSTSNSTTTNTTTSSPTPSNPTDGSGGEYSSSTARMLSRAMHSEALMKVNALGPLYVTEALEDDLKKAAYDSPNSKACVIFIGSVGGGSAAVFPEYCAADLMSKAAMTYLSKHIAAKYVREPIDVMCISPGATETDMFKQSTLSKVSDPVAFIHSMPKRKLIQPEDIANTVFWLATQCPGGIFHGANLDASMGLAVRPGLQTETENSR